MGYPTRIYYTEKDKALMWDRWQNARRSLEAFPQDIHCDRLQRPWGVHRRRSAASFIATAVAGATGHMLPIRRRGIGRSGPSPVNWY